MPRIRTIKPEFFTSEDIVGLTPLARILYVALWCEADREGRLKWKPGTFKLRYLPKDEVSVDELAAELIDRGLVVLYGEGLAHIPSFKDHQHINPREAHSTLPAPQCEQPVDNSRVSDASARVSDTQVGREGKEGKGREVASARVEGQNHFEKSSQVNTESNPLTWWRTPAGIMGKGVELKIPPYQGEQMQAYKQRLFDEMARRRAA